MPVTDHDTDPKITAYSNPSVLVSTSWVADHLDDPGLVIVESDEDVLLYETGHVPGAVKIDWHTDLQDPVARDYVDGEGFAELMRAKGIGRDDTVVFYGDKSNWWAAYALWVFSLFDHPDVRLMDGGRDKWLAEDRPVTTDKPQREATDYPVVERDDAPIRAYREHVEEHLEVAGQLLDVRSPQEFTGERTHMPDYPQEGAMRGGHIPGAKGVPWGRAAQEDGTFKPVEQLRELYEQEQGLTGDQDTIVYCRIGERSSHSWFVLTHLLGHENVRNYDGSWTEWGNLVRAPIEKG